MCSSVQKQFCEACESLALSLSHSVALSLTLGSLLLPLPDNLLAWKPQEPGRRTVGPFTRQSERERKKETGESRKELWREREKKGRGAGDTENEEKDWKFLELKKKRIWERSKGASERKEVFTL